MTQGIKPQTRLSGNPISLGKASKKYGIPVSTLSDWVARGEVAILRRPERRGQAMLVDEGSVIVAREQHRKSWDQATYSPPVNESPSHLGAPLTEKPKYKTTELIEAYLRWGETVGLKPPTMETSRQVLGVFSEKCPFLPLSHEPILNFLHDLKVGATTKKKYHKVIRAFYNYLEDFHGIPTPLKKRMIPRAEKQPPIRILSREEVIKLFNAATSFQERMMLETLYVTRIRVGELISLTNDSIFPDHIEVTGKTGRREIPISEDLYTSLAMLGEGSLFRDEDGKPITRYGVYQRVAKCMLRAGIKGKKLGPHTLRHTSLTHLYEDTGDLPLVQEAAGHKGIAMTMAYTHPQAAKQRERLRALDPIKRLGPTKRPGPGKADAAELAAILDKDGEEDGPKDI